MWVKIDAETYMQSVVGLTTISSITDAEGTRSSGDGRPYIETIWGVSGAGLTNDYPMLKYVGKKEHRHQLEWDVEYFESKNYLHESV